MLDPILAQVEAVRHGAAALRLPALSTFHILTMLNIIRAAQIKRRNEWGAARPTGPMAADWDYDSIVVHYSGHGNLESPKRIQDFDREHRSWQDVSYHYIIGKDGQIYEGREIIFKGSHVYQQNTGKIGIVCLGHFDASMLNWAEGVGYGGERVLAPLFDALRRLCHVLMANFPIRIFGGHLEYGVSESCPGSNLMPFVKQLRTELKLAAPTFRKFD